MADKRWQPPPMETPQALSRARVTVDEKVVRKMLAVNPSLRKGRTTQQVKRALEGGEGIGAQTQTAPTIGTASTPKTNTSAQQELSETINFFLRKKAEAFKIQLDELATRRLKIDDEEQKAKDLFRTQIVAFLALLDETTVAAYGSAALAKHVSFLTEIDLTPSTLIAHARRAGRA